MKTQILKKSDIATLLSQGKKIQVRDWVKDRDANLIDVTDISQITVTMVRPTTVPLLQNEYCCGVCFKCAQQALIEANTFGVPYDAEYLKDCKRMLLNYCENRENLNKVNSRHYFENVMGIPMSEIPVKYHQQILGKQPRPDGWKPKPDKKSK